MSEMKQDQPSRPKIRAQQLEDEITTRVSTTSGPPKADARETKAEKETPPAIRSNEHTVEDFLAEFEKGLEGGGSKAARQAFKLLFRKQKFVGGADPSEGVARCLLASDVAFPVAFKLYGETRQGKRSAVLHKTATRLRREAIARTSYPTLLEGELPEQRLQRIRSWIASLDFSRRQEQPEPALDGPRKKIELAPLADLDLLCASLACLVGEVEPNMLIDGTCALLARYYEQVCARSKGATLESPQAFIAELMDRLFAPPGRGRLDRPIRSFLRLVEPRRKSLERKSRALEVRLSSCERELKVSQARGDETAHRVDKLEKERSEESALRRDLDSQMNELRARIEEQQKSHRSHLEDLEKRLRVESSGRLWRQAERIRFDVNEALLCLSRGDPNVSMAISRLKRIEQFLEKPHSEGGK